MRKRLLIILLLSCLSASLPAQTKLANDFRVICDSLSTLVRERTGVQVKLRLRTVTKKESKLDFYFTESLSDIPWREDDVNWLRETLKSLFPENESAYKVGSIYGNGTSINSLVVPELHSDGTVHASTYKATAPQETALVEEIGGQKFEKGLSGRHIALWQSHGRYFETKTKRWEWQRAPDFMTVEDMYTQSFVIPFLIPMLENAGACVMSPRERDTQKYESVVDNDLSFLSPRKGLTRRSGSYRESGEWKSAGIGFADSKEVYIRNDNPFSMGTARQCKAYDGHPSSLARAIWTPDIPQRGEYAVYISYKTLPNSTSHAHYTINHLGGKTEFSVNQKMAGGTWVYLGTFEFAPNEGCSVELDNQIVENGTLSLGEIVTADAVRFGGGMGKIARGAEDTDLGLWETSGLPSYAEGALYNMQWAGTDSTVIRKHNDDYTNDFADRGPWVSLMTGGSKMNPKAKGKGIPFDLSFAFHSDAGTHPNDSTIGTLAIYTLKNEGSKKFADGGNRMASRDLCNYVQTQVVRDIQHKYEPEWTRRELWDRSYSESRTSGIPSMILELMSHQNFADMKYGHDPSFKFDVSRAVYKGLLKFLSDRYACPYEVQPLPVHDFSAVLAEDGTLRLGWTPTVDSLEQSAISKGFILYTRIDGGAFDQGRKIETSETEGKYSTSVKIEPGHLYSYKIVAFNDGGRSFPSEILSAGISTNPKSQKPVLVVNNFYRLAAPAWFDTPEYAGFDLGLDRGVAYIKDISYVGDMYQFRRDLPWTDDDNPGFGASYTDQAGIQIAGNNFDYPAIHGKAILACGYSFCSTSAGDFISNVEEYRRFKSVDLICGKEVTTPMGRGAVPHKYQVFPSPLQEALRHFCSKGGKLLVSGANIGTDVWDKVYPSVKPDSLYTLATKRFVQDVLGYTWITNYASHSGKVETFKNKLIETPSLELSFHTKANENVYCVETADGIAPSNKNGNTFLRYSDTKISAAVCTKQPEYKTICFGFPLEVLKREEDLESLMALSLEFLGD